MWFRRAADQGHAGVQFNLSTMYATGRGVPQDYVTAHMWANLAGARGDEEARELRDRLAEEMSAGKIAGRTACCARVAPCSPIGVRIAFLVGAKPGLCQVPSPLSHVRRNRRTIAACDVALLSLPSWTS